MSFKPMLAALAFVASSAAWAQSPPAPVPPMPPEVFTLTAGLGITECDSAGNCTIQQMQIPGEISVTLNEVQPNEMHGVQALVADSNGIRYIGVITVDRYEADGQFGDYMLSVEIIGDSGTVARMNILAPDAQHIPTAGLSAPGKAIGG